MKNYLSVLIILTMLSGIFTGCQKGDPGENGSTVLSGAGIPSNSIGKRGDYFIDTVGHVLWGPRNDNSWGAGFALVGPQGLPGKSTLNGAGAPTAAIGNAGDFYIDVTAKALYGPKGPAGWGIPTSLIGPAGATGPAGPQGNAGTPAQVIYSPWITSPYASRDTTIDGTCLRIRHLNAPSLSTTILNQGVMITYFRVGSIGPYALPYTSDAGGATNTINCVYNLQKIFVYRHTFNTCRFNSSIPESYPGQPVLINLPQSLEYRYILIPGLVSGGRSAGTSVNVSQINLPGYNYSINLQTTPYETVCNMLGIAK
jgi:hypothetical protein